MRRVDHRGVDHHVVVEELRGPGGVGHDATDRACHQVHVVGPVGPEPVVDRRLVAQVELVTSSDEESREALSLELPEHSRSDQTGMACDEDSRILRYRRHCSLPNPLVPPTRVRSVTEDGTRDRPPGPIDLEVSASIRVEPTTNDRDLPEWNLRWFATGRTGAVHRGTTSFRQRAVGGSEGDVPTVVD